MLLICSSRQMGAYWQIPWVHVGVRVVSPSFRPAKSSVMSCTVKLHCVPPLHQPGIGSNNNRTQQRETSHFSVKAHLFSFRFLPALHLWQMSPCIQQPWLVEVTHDSPCARWEGLLHTGQAIAGGTRSDCSKGATGFSCRWRSRASLGHNLGGLEISQLWAVDMCMQISTIITI